MGTLCFRYSLIFTVIYLLLYIGRDQQSTSFLVNYTEHAKFLAIALLVISIVAYALQVLFSGAHELSRKKCIRCNRPALKGFLYCHEHLQKANDHYHSQDRVASGRR